MIWYDTQFAKRAGLPKWCSYIGSCFLFTMAYFAAYSAIETIDFVEKTVPAIGALGFMYLGICHIFMIIKGSEYVEVIKKEKDYFILTNIYNKKIKFTVSDVLSVETSKFSIMDKFITGFAKYEPGLNLFLKDGSKYFITSDMENIDSLKEHLLGNEISSDRD